MIETYRQHLKNNVHKLYEADTDPRNYTAEHTAQRGYRVPSEKQRRKDARSVRRALDKAALQDRPEEEKIGKKITVEQKPSLAAKIAVVGAVGLTALGIANKDKIIPKRTPEPTATYIVQPGDTLSGIAAKVDANKDGKPGTDNPLPLIYNLGKQVIAEAGDNQFLQPGMELKLPAKADLDPNQPGVQLDKPR